jgi:hypothetical protein
MVKMKSILTICAALILAAAGQWARADESAMESLKGMGGPMSSVAFPTSRPVRPHTPIGYLLTALDQINDALPKLSGEKKSTMVTAKLDIIVAFGDIGKHEGTSTRECSVVLTMLGMGEACVYRDAEKLTCYKDERQALEDARARESKSECVLVRFRRTEVILQALEKPYRLMAGMKDPKLTAPIQETLKKAMAFYKD